MRGIFFDEDHARAAAAQLQADGYAATVGRERLAGEDDDEAILNHALIQSRRRDRR